MDQAHPLGKRMSFLALIAWVSLCLIVAGWMTQLDPTLRKLWASAGLIGLASAIGLAASVKSQLRAQRKLIESYMCEARTDPLTGLGNRRALNQELDRRIAQWQRQAIPVSLLIVDVDHFKKFNDCHGHQAGDEMLRAVGRVLCSTFREMDLVTRYGGEEFAVVLPGITLSEAKPVAERVRLSVAENSYRYRDTDLCVTVSVGIAEAKRSDDADEFVRRADAALYAAKKAGRNCTYVHDGETCCPIEADCPAIHSAFSYEQGWPGAGAASPQIANG
jgi:diguanylate cyclase